MSKFEQIVVESQGPVAHIRLNRPGRHNAQTETMWSELACAGAQLAGDGETRVAIVSGHGRSFSSGIDLAEMKPGGFLRRLGEYPKGDPDPMLPAIAIAQDSMRWMRDAPFLIVAAVHGNAIGAGCQLALAADVRIVAEDAVFALKEVEYGLIPDLGATATLTELVGTQRALDLILTGRTVDGREAVRLGLALEALPSDDVPGRAVDFANDVARNSRTAMSYVKAAVYERDYTRSLDLAGRGQAACIRERGL